MIDWLRRLSTVCLDLLFPPAERCLLCGRTLRDQQEPLCSVCVAEMKHPPGTICIRCGRPLTDFPGDLTGLTWRSATGCRLCQGAQWAFTQARSIGPYEGSLRLAVHRLKFRGQQHFGRALADLLYQSADRDWWQNAEAIVPVPLHPDRLQQRGFNQAEVVAEQLAQRTGRPMLRLLMRTLATTPQMGLTRRQRQQNVRSAFRMIPGPPKRWPVRGRTLLLVDDVLTTGSTADACAQVLLQAGAAEVRVATLAITNLD
ncbi:MAG: ComF family protein [Bacillota bacterium]|jgi:ComF family protein